MNKIIIVGHSAAGIVEVEARLRHYGMQPPLPSLREGLLPEEITDSLCRAHHPAPSGIHTQESDYQQIVAGPVWRGIAADLLLGNLDLELWGWADTQSIHLLDHWRELDPLAAFVLVYDEPQRALEEAAIHGAAEPNESRARQWLDNWAAYNGAMLRFFLHHPDRCLLVNSSQVRQAPDELFDQLDRRLQTPCKSRAAFDDTSTGTPALRLETLQRALALTTCAPAKALRTLHAGAAERYLLDRYLGDHPSYLHFYEELQAAANLPLHPGKTPPEESGQAWLALVAQRRLTGEIIAQLYHERSLQLTQLHQIQEQLEYLHMRGRVWQKQPQTTRKTSAPLAGVGAADRIKQQLSYRLGATLVNRSRSIGGWLVMPFAVAGEIRRYHLEKKRRAPQKQPPIHTYEDAQEANRVKNHLSYRLGSVLVKHGRTPWGWFVMPFALGGELRSFKQTRNRSHQNPLPSAP